MIGHAGEGRLHQPEAAGCKGGRERLHGWVAIESDDVRAGGQEGAAVAAGAKGRIDDQLAGRGGDDGEDLFQHHRLVGAAHSAAPSLARRSSARARSASRANSRWVGRSARKASRPQIWNRSPRPTRTTVSVIPNIAHMLSGRVTRPAESKASWDEPPRKVNSSA